MNIKYFFALLLILSSNYIIAQDFSYKNKNAVSTETISFSLAGNRIVDGEWEHVSNDPNTSGEVYGFTGKKINNKFVIVFTGTIPYTIPGSKRKATWSLSGKTLIVPMIEKNKATKKMERHNSSFILVANNS